jgi:hypothetical protein
MPLRMIMLSKSVAGWQYGTRGHVYTFPIKSARANKVAKEMAIRQAIAISYHTGKRPDL